MPTDNPRVNVTLSPSLDSLVGRLAALQRVSKSSVLRELLEAAAPALTRAVALMEAAARSKPAVLRGFASSLSAAQSQIEGVLEDQLAAMDGTVDLFEAVEVVRGKRPSRTGRQAAVQTGGGAGSPAKALQDPPSSNRGVKSPKQRVNPALRPRSTKGAKHEV